MDTIDVNIRVINEIRRTSEKTGIPPAQLLIEAKMVDTLIDFLLTFFFDYLLDRIKKQFDIIDLVEEADLRHWAWDNDFEERR